MQFAAFQGPARIFAQHFIGPVVPDHHRAGAVIAFRNGSFKIRIVQRMVFHLHSKAAVSTLHGQAFRHCPGLEHAFHLQPEIIMQPRGVVFLDDETLLRSRARTHFTLGFSCPLEIAFRLVLFQPHTPSFPVR